MRGCALSAAVNRELEFEVQEFHSIMAMLEKKFACLLNIASEVRWCLIRITCSTIIGLL